MLSMGMVLTYLLLLFDKDESALHLWNIVGHIVVLGMIFYGFLAALYQIRSGHRASGWYLSGALIIFLIFTIDDIVSVHFSAIYPFKLPVGFLPFDYFPVLFMIIMGIKLARDIQHHIQLQNRIINQERRWSELLEKVQLLVVSLDDRGKITYVNPYFLNLTGYQKHELLGEDWFGIFLPGEIREKVFRAFREHLNTNAHPHFINNIKKKNGEAIVIHWSNVQNLDPDSKVTGSLSIGADITRRENAYKEIKELKEKLEKENIDLRERISGAHITTGIKIIGSSDEIRYAIQRATRVAPTDSSVLLEGETGAGKELFAELIHRQSMRKSGPYVKINCSALPGELIESELFGHEKGAFTGAIQQKKGRFELAHNGTLFLDEISELPIELQPKLLHVLQNGEFERVGGQKTLKADVRLVSATNRNLAEYMAKGKFREDLFYRLNVYPITIPPLRSRPGDIQELLNYFISKMSRKAGKTFETISKHDLAQLQKYHWPGNVRELENIVERAIISSVEPNLRFDLEELAIRSDNRHKTSGRSLDEAEREHILAVLETCNWKINGIGGAAQKLNLPPSTLRSKMKKLSIQRPPLD